MFQENFSKCLIECYLEDTDITIEDPKEIELKLGIMLEEVTASIEYFINDPSKTLLKDLENCTI